LQQTAAEAGKVEAAAEAVEEETKQVRKKKFEGMEIDPRGFIVPQVPILPWGMPHKCPTCS
jgi:hypothetical protein